MMTPYEFHITISPEQADDFAKKFPNLKLHRFKNVNKNGQAFSDVMTGIKLSFADQSKAMDYLRRVSSEIATQGFEILREKIETVPWGLESGFKAFTPRKYFETHFKFFGEPTGSIGQLLYSEDVVKGAKYLTLRTYNDYYSHLKVVGWQARFFISRDLIVIGDPQHEFVFYDSNLEHDNAWMEAA